MSIFVDTSVLVAACWQGHPHHARAFPVLLRVSAKQDKGFISMHSIAEFYSVLTRLPVVPRIHPIDAERMIVNNLLAHFQTVPLSQRDYTEALAAVAAGSWAGGKIYDALLLRCAMKCNPDRILTFNLVDFRRLAPPAMQAKISAPS